MYLSIPFLVAWSVVTICAMAYAMRNKRVQRRNEAILRHTKRSLQKLESKNGKLWHEVLKRRAMSDYTAGELTVTNAGKI